MRQWNAAAIVNPCAGRGGARGIWRRERARLEKRLGPIVTRETAAPGHAAELAREFRALGHDLLIVVGGDGTLSETANGLLAESAAALDVTLSPIPAGKGSDLARTLIPGARPRLFDVIHIAFQDAGGLTKQRWCVNMASFGLGAEVARRAQGRSPAGYLLGAVAALSRTKALSVRLTIDGDSEEFRAVHVAVGNGSSQGGGMRICPRARPDDGRIDVTAIGEVGLLDLAANLRLIYSGRIYDHPKVRHFLGGRIRAEAEAALELDGDAVGRLPAEFTIAPAILPIVRL